MQWIGVQINISAQRQSAIAISQRFCYNNAFQEEKSKLEDQDQDKDNVEGDDPWDLQASHRTHVAGIIYARELAEGDSSIVSCRKKFH